MSGAAVDPGIDRSGFRHEVCVYDGDAVFAASVAPYVRTGVRAGEAMLVVVAPPKIDRLRAALGPDAAEVRFVDVHTVGRNPGTIIPLWRDFVDEHVLTGRPVRGVGEPVWPGRNRAALAECHHHEALLNLAFRDDLDFGLLCPYDARSLAPDVLDGAFARHPYPEDRPENLSCYDEDVILDAVLAEPLPAPAGDARSLGFGIDDLREVRALVRAEALARGLGADRCDDLVLAVTELAANSINHGRGRGMLRVWHEDGHLVCEVIDAGRIRDPLVGRRRPAASPPNARGLWLVHHLCDLVQLRSSAAGTVVRLHVATCA
jgi:anti-sigma regulatory factor (Ser/Thr protein kinase)